jgi:hypothetical protein
MRRQHSHHGLNYTLSQSVYPVHPIWSPLEKLPISSELFTTNTHSPSRKVSMQLKKSSTTSRLSTLLPSELLPPCTCFQERSRLWESRWSCLVKDPMRSLVVSSFPRNLRYIANKQDTSTSTLHRTQRTSTRNVSSESRTYTLPIVYVPTNLPWLGVLKLEFHSSTRSSWRSP